MEEEEEEKVDMSKSTNLDQSFSLRVFLSIIIITLLKLQIIKVLWYISHCLILFTLNINQDNFPQ